MTPYTHPPAALAIFQTRLSADAGLTAPYTLTCGKPQALTDALAAQLDCVDWRGRYNTLVDLKAEDGYVGEVLNYPYNRIDLASFAKAIGPILKGSAETIVELLPAINLALGTQFLVEEIVDRPLPVCDCACGPIIITLQADPASLLYFGELRLPVTTHALPLSVVVCQPFLGALPLPPLTP